MLAKAWWISKSQKNLYIHWNTETSIHVTVQNNFEIRSNFLPNISIIPVIMIYKYPDLAFPWSGRSKGYRINITFSLSKRYSGCNLDRLINALE